MFLFPISTLSLFRPWSLFAGSYSADAAGVGDARMRCDRGDRDERDSKYQVIVSACLACGIFMPPRAALSGDSHLAFLLRAWMAQR